MTRHGMFTKFWDFLGERSLWAGIVNQATLQTLGMMSLKRCNFYLGSDLRHLLCDFDYYLSNTYFIQALYYIFIYVTSNQLITFLLEKVTFKQRHESRKKIGSMASILGKVNRTGVAGCSEWRVIGNEV